MGDTDRGGDGRLAAMYGQVPISHMVVSMFGRQVQLITPEPLSVGWQVSPQWTKVGSPCAAYAVIYGISDEKGKAASP
jgi:hypothetical protein